MMAAYNNMNYGYYQNNQFEIAPMRNYIGHADVGGRGGDQFLYSGQGGRSYNSNES